MRASPSLVALSSTLAAAALAVCTPGCFFFGSASSAPSESGTTATGTGNSGTGGGSTGGAGAGGTDPTTKDIAQYDALQAQLEKNRSQFLTPGASGLAGFGTHLYWLDFTNGPPTLQSYESTASKTTNYTFSIGDDTSYNYRVSNSIVVSAENTGSNTVFHTFALDQPNESLGDLLADPPSSGVEWWAYSPDGGDLYYVETEGMTTLMKWTPGQASPNSPTMLFNLEDLGVKVGEFQDFIIANGLMVFIESGRVWSLDLTTKVPVALGNMTESQGADVLTDGVIISTATGPFFYSNATKMLRDIAAAIAASSYKLNTTFASAHLFDNGAVTTGNTGFTNFNDVIGYIGESGLFTFDMKTSVVTPLLLNARDDSTVYTSPVFLDDGSVFVQGLQSTEGDIGSDGPIYRLNTKL
jgi:hypothetical protein